MRGALPPRYWRKVVAATQGVVLVSAVADVLPRPLMAAALAASLALLIESFGRDIAWLWHHRLVRPGHRHGGWIVRNWSNSGGQSRPLPRSGHPVLHGRRGGDAHAPG
jgi:hypothetical protein